MTKKRKRISDPFEYLLADHKKVAALLIRLSKKTTARSEAAREDLFEELTRIFLLHAALEEAIIYPVLESVKKTHDITLEAFEEHCAAKELIVELSGMDVEDEEWITKFTVLKEHIEHHIAEEEGHLFPKAKNTLDDDEKERLST